MNIRRYREDDTVEMCDIYYNTIHAVNSADYTKEELEAWAPSNSYNEETYKKDTDRWNRINPFIAVHNNTIIGFAELEEKGHINCFFVHHEHQGLGAGAALLDACVKEAKKLGYPEIIAEVSITSRDYFAKKGFKIIEPMLCDIKGLKMKFYNMKLDLR